MKMLHQFTIRTMFMLLTIVLISGCTSIDNKKKARSEGRELYKKWGAACSAEARAQYPERIELVVVEKWRDKIIKTGETCKTTTPYRNQETMRCNESLGTVTCKTTTPRRTQATVECKDTLSTVKEAFSVEEYKDVNADPRRLTLQFCAASQCRDYMNSYPNKWNPQGLFSKRNLERKMDRCSGKVL
jgi:hypothetical protein